MIRESELVETVQRPSWDDYFMEVADSISKRATCDRSGCVIAKDNQILVAGYVGAPAQIPVVRCFADILNYA